MNLPTQNQTCTLAAFITGALCLTLLFIPGLIFWLFNMAHEQSGAIMSRRAAMLFAGLSFLAWRARHLAPSSALSAIFNAFALVMTGLAIVGFVEFLRGGVGVGIWLAIIVEALFAYAFYTLAKGAD